MSVSETAPDLATEAGVLEYVMGTPFVADKIVALSGGNANFVYRLFLKTPYNGCQTVVLKHAKPYVKAFSYMEFSVKRQLIETAATRRVRKHEKPDSFVSVPAVYLHDDKVNAIIMEDSGEHSTNMKQYIRENRLQSVEIAQKIGASIGEFLAHVHAWPVSVEEREIFAGNTEAPVLQAKATYGELARIFVADAQATDPILAGQPIELSPDDLATIGEIAAAGTKDISESHENYVVGDFWTGNILLGLDETGEIKRILVVDWEVSSFGSRGADVGQFLAEVDLLQQFHPETTAVSSAILKSFMQAYRDTAQCGSDHNLARRARIGWGTHFVAWAPKAGWGGPQETREVMRKGVEAALGAHRASEAELKGSAVGDLLT